MKLGIAGLAIACFSGCVEDAVIALAPAIRLRNGTLAKPFENATGSKVSAYEPSLMFRRVRADGSWGTTWYLDADIALKLLEAIKR